jgi:hypothetical protein
VGAADVPFSKQACWISASATLSAGFFGRALELARSTYAFQSRKPRVHTLRLNASLRPGDEVAAAEVSEVGVVMRRRRSTMNFSTEV